MYDFFNFRCLIHKTFKIIKFVKKELPLYVYCLHEDGIGYVIAELYCNEDGSDWGYCTKKGSHFKTENEADSAVKLLMDEAGSHAFQKVNWIVD